MSTITFEHCHVFSAPYVYVHACTCMYMYMGQFPQKQPITYNYYVIHDCIKCYKNSLRLNHYNFRMINAIDFLFSTLLTTPFLNGKIHFGALHQFLADATRSDTPWDSKPPHLQTGASKSLQIQYVCTGVLLPLICSVR